MRNVIAAVLLLSTSASALDSGELVTDGNTLNTGFKKTWNQNVQVNMPASYTVAMEIRRP